MKIKKETTDWGKIYYYRNRYCMFAIYTYDDDESTVYLSNVKVKKSERGCGFGNRILRFVSKEARKHNYSIICLKVLKLSWMHNWYSRHGYKDLEENNNYVWMKHNL